MTDRRGRSSSNSLPGNWHKLWHIPYDCWLSCLNSSNCSCFLEYVFLVEQLGWPVEYLLNRCYLKLGDWQTALQGYSEKSIPQILQYYAAATDNDRNCYKAWHAWAYMNFETVLYYKSQQSSGAEGANNGNICRTPPPVQTSSVSATCNYVFLCRSYLFKRMNVMIFPQTFKCPWKLATADKQSQNFLCYTLSICRQAGG